jgi:hypothetical protein
MAVEGPSSPHRRGNANRRHVAAALPFTGCRPGRRWHRSGAGDSSPASAVAAPASPLDPVFALTDRRALEAYASWLGGVLCTLSALGIERSSLLGLEPGRKLRASPRLYFLLHQKS